LGDPRAGIWFVGENPSLTTARRALGTAKAAPTVESQWAISRGDKLFRRCLVHQGFKSAPPFSPGGWRCYITDVIKQAAAVGPWNKQGKAKWLRLAEVWADVLAWELDYGRPRLIVTMGDKTHQLLNHLALVRQLRFPQIVSIQHYAYIGQRPDGKLPPMAPQRVRAYQAQMAQVAKLWASLARRGAYGSRRGISD
jgi:hypothetical protein